MTLRKEYRYNPKHGTQQNFSALVSHQRFAFTEQKSNDSQATANTLADNHRGSKSTSKDNSTPEANRIQERETNQLDNPSFSGFDWTKLYQRDLESKLNQQRAKHENKNDSEHAGSGEARNKSHAIGDVGKEKEGSSRRLRSHRGK